MKFYRVCKVNSFGVIESRTSAMPFGKARRLCDENNLRAIAAGSADRYMVIAIDEERKS